MNDYDFPILHQLFYYFPGKSLDKCVELREVSGPVSVEDKFIAEQVKEEERVKKLEKTSQPESSVFEFLNKNISRSAGK